MFLRFESSVAGLNFSYAPGDVAEWPDEEEAQRMVERGIAEELLDHDAAKAAAGASGRPVRKHRGPAVGIEKAMRRPAETAAAKR